MKKDITHLLNPPKKEKLHEGIVAQIKTLIHSKKLGIGDRLPAERELAKLFQVSRVVIRESLRSLEQSGLVEIKPGPAGGPFVSYNLHKPISAAAHDLLDQGKLSLPYFLEARQAIECVTVRRAAEKAKKGDLERLRQINEWLIKDMDNPETLRKHNTAFHVAVAEIAGNPLLKLMVQSLLDLLGVVFPNAGQSKDFIRHTYERHVAILDAMEKRDIGRCEELMALDAGYTANLQVDR
ncbi:MAG TPA: FadR/GntR family transcriptional regulator [Syntrophorhabdaceae bacterium]|nr:FadR/GntR family transcriptional regulator [Syntrophorhabdaceae bacterium]